MYLLCTEHVFLYFTHDQVLVTGSGPFVATLPPDSLPVSGVAKVEISFEATGNTFTASNVEMEACVESIGGY